MTSRPAPATRSAEATAFRVGVNYWPARTAMAWWSRFEPDEVTLDFARIADAGFDSVRIFLSWEDFQPHADRVSAAMLDRLVVVADLAAESGLDLVPTLFTGHMSGVNWIPSWALGQPGTRRRFRVVSAGSTARRDLLNWYTVPEVAEAQARLATACAVTLAGHPALWAWDLGNESSNCVLPPNRTVAVAWLERMATAIRDADETSAITLGLHMEDLEQDHSIGPAEAAAVCDFLTMHGYPIYAAWADGPTDEHLLGFLTEITRWLGGGIDVVFSEFGLPTHRAEKPPGEPPSVLLVDEDSAAAYTDRALHTLRAAGATGAMLWCYSDYDVAIWQDPPLDRADHERSFGLWRADGSPKPSVSAVALHMALDCVAVTGDRPWIDIEPAQFYVDVGSHLPRLYSRYRAVQPATPTSG